jgi:hypothetical protein
MVLLKHGTDGLHMVPISAGFKFIQIPNIHRVYTLNWYFSGLKAHLASARASGSLS